MRTYARLAEPEQFDIRRMERVMVVNRRRPVTIYEVYDEDPDALRAAKRAAQPAFDEAFALFDAGEVDRARAAFERCRQLLPEDPVAPLHLAHCDAIARGELTPGQEVALRPEIVTRKCSLRMVFFCHDSHDHTRRGGVVVMYLSAERLALANQAVSRNLRADQCRLAGHPALGHGRSRPDSGSATIT